MGRGAVGAGFVLVAVVLGACEDSTGPAGTEPPDSSDVVLVRGALGPLKAVVVLHDDPEDLPISIHQTVETTDTIVRLPSHTAGEASVLVFSWDHPPERATAVFTPDADTVRLTLRPPVSIDLDVVLYVAPIDDERVRVEAELDRVDEVAREQGWGLRVGEVTWIDSTAVGPVEIDGHPTCLAAGPVERIRVRVVHELERAFGYACPPGHVYLSRHRTDGTPILAHELGHTFNLRHTDGGLMHPGLPETELTEGQIQRSHMDDQSALNVTLGALPATERRPCIAVGACLPLDFRLGERPRPGG